eukprot:EC814941.1.p2 GENE.EC814941.1~~EC814941.1.p2  ORF type:complete len:100 (+),score=42.93 EC814941.1:15-314(+)
MCGSEADRDLIIQSILSTLPSEFENEYSIDPQLPQSCLSIMVRDQFGNFVIQRLLENASSPQRDRLLAHLGPIIPVLKKYTYGKHIAAKVEKMLAPSPK